MESLLFLKKKLDVSVKDHTCGNRWKQLVVTNKTYATSPMVSLGVVLVMATLFFHNKWFVAILYVPGAFLTSEMYKEFLMVLRCRLEELMVKSDLIIYQKFVTVENVHTALFIQMQKGLYGYLRRTLIFYKELLSNLESKGFFVDSYEPFMSNITIKGVQIMIT